MNCVAFNSLSHSLDCFIEYFIFSSLFAFFALVLFSFAGMIELETNDNECFIFFLIQFLFWRLIGIKCHDNLDKSKVKTQRKSRRLNVFDILCPMTNVILMRQLSLCVLICIFFRFFFFFFLLLFLQNSKFQWRLHENVIELYRVGD